MKKAPPAILKFHGVRGSRPVHTAINTNYGGNSTCLEIDTGMDFSLIVDGGTGLQHVSNNLGKHPQRRRMHILVTHTHWDHVLMLPFLHQLEHANFEVHFHAPDVAGLPFEKVFAKLMKHGRLPIPAQAIQAKLFFHKVNPGLPFLIEGKVKVIGFQVNHQHITLGYKISHEESIVAIIPDIASISNGNLLGEGFAEKAKEIGTDTFEKLYNDALVKFLQDVPNVVFDTHFNSQNLKADWGHATPEIAMDICARAKVKRLFMFHHAPEDNDHDVATKQMLAHEFATLCNMEVINAREEDAWPITAA